MSHAFKALVRLTLAIACLAAAAALFLPATASAQRLERCADEGGVCRLPFPAEVVFGARGRNTSRFFDRPSVPCTTRVFGDPAPGIRKACYIARRGGGFGGGGFGGGGFGDGGGRGRWSFCANEGQFCGFRGRRVVRYGAQGRFTQGIFRDGVRCGNQAFGDPAPGTPKRCYLQQ